ncbi:CDP-alcohol phosphatidyltransferase family protein [Nitrosomonas sp. HPC101]|uniref:CDP-alcohol phosphatidyltransferase family protein n=1 Tax=Nitrosomonas sp. HPC101 TaxID=1658667 RepID=UPI00136A77B0|nr:CDP-alcohol phosphatidyltransferase family protein [Nitrosomonas sp. HPC101]MXS84915.1 CDP-alcohol phosphatidyltransferase family protein [Nitrosomonas sp. HPC101]
MSAIFFVHIVGNSEISLWGMDGRTRLERMLRTIKTAIVVEEEEISQLTGTDPVLLLRADYLFDSRVINALMALREPVVLVAPLDEIPVAILTDGKNAAAMREVLNEKRLVPDDLSICTLKDLPIQVQQNLKKKDPPYVLPMLRCNQLELESELFAASYKGVTDLVTKWLWPWPAFMVTRLCVRLGLKPNHVTLLSLVLAVLAGVAFWYGAFGIGLMMAWLMTFLDTVDGKLARVTLTSSKLGDVLDHGLDIIHPPLWYLAWGVGLMATATPVANLELLVWLMFIGYVGGRLCEGAFQFWLASFDIFIWCKVDSFHRLITARRNPNLILLTAGWMADRPDIGFILVVSWHLLSTLFLIYRLFAAWQSRSQNGVLHSWMENIDPVRDRQQLAVRVFIRQPLSQRYIKPVSDGQ